MYQENNSKSARIRMPAHLQTHLVNWAGITQWDEIFKKREKERYRSLWRESNLGRKNSAVMNQV